MKLLQAIRKNLYVFICIAVVTLSIIPLLAAALYSHPTADDYFSGAIGTKALDEGGLFGLLAACFNNAIYQWTAWQGTYSSCFIFPLDPIIWGENLYWLTCFSMLAITLLGFIVLFWSLGKYVVDSNDGMASATTGLLSWFFWIMTLPSPEEGLYWYVGSAHYMVFIGCGCMAVGVALAVAAGAPHKVRNVIILSLLSFFVVGGNQLTALGMLLILGFISGVAIIKRRNYIILIPLAIAIVGFTLSVIAPGNDIRAKAIGYERDFIFALVGAAKTTFAYCENKVDFRFMLLLLAMLPLMAKLSKREGGAGQNALWKGAGKSIVAFIVLSLLYTFAVLCVPFYAVGYEGEGRMVNTSYFVFIVLAILVVLSIEVFAIKCIRIHWKGFACNWSSQKRFLVLAPVCLCAIIVMHSTCLTAVRGIANGSFAEYDAVMNERLAILTNSSVENAVLPRLDSLPPLIGGGSQITDNPEDWVNDGVAKYYGKESVDLEEPQ